MSVTEISTARLRKLPPEPWGRRMFRARKDVAGLSGEVAAELVGAAMKTSTATISRLETLESPPDEPVIRQRAVCLALLYGLEPAELDLGPEDLPSGWTYEIIAQMLDSEASARSYADRALSQYAPVHVLRPARPAPARRDIEAA